MFYIIMIGLFLTSLWAYLKLGKLWINMLAMGFIIGLTVAEILRTIV